jgi:hypothetical protein
VSLTRSLVGAFYTAWNSGRDCRAVVSESNAHYWHIGRAVPTRQGITLSISGWTTFHELAEIVTQELVESGLSGLRRPQ